MNHAEIIQTLLNTYSAANYLEIGVELGDNFLSMDARYKVGICPIKPGERLGSFLNYACIYHAMTSDTFFSSNHESYVKFDVVFIDGDREYEQAYRDIVNALDVLAPGGAIVMHNCKPTNEIMSSPRRIFNMLGEEAQEVNHGKWTGDVWKAIVHTRSFHNDLLVFTLDCDFGCAIITKDIPESSLNFSEVEIKALGFDDLKDNYADFLNLKSPEYLSEFLLRKKHRGKQSRYGLYVESIDVYANACERDYRLDKAVEVRTIQNGIILSPTYYPDGVNPCPGGVYDAAGSFVAGHIRDINASNPYFVGGPCPERLAVGSDGGVITNNIKYLNETVVYGGHIENDFGHVLVEYLSRLWYFIENPELSYKYVFTSAGCNYGFIDILLTLGLREENIVFVKEPTRFNTIIIPDQASYMSNGFTGKMMMVYDAIRDSVIPAAYEKVYLTRTKLVPKDTVNEEYFESYFTGLGYKVISPERLPFKEQVAIMAGVKEVACVGGTLPHQVLFCQNGVSLTILNKTRSANEVQPWINQARAVRCNYIDASMNIMPCTNHGASYLLMPNNFWKQYVYEHYNIINKNDVDSAHIILEQLKQWTKNLAAFHDYGLSVYRNFTLAHVIIELHKYILGKDLDEPTKTRLLDILKH